jgi:hypothetical protein
MKPPMAIRIYKGIGGKESEPDPEKVDLHASKRLYNFCVDFSI